MAGRGRARQHREVRRKDGADEVPTISIDYGFLGPRCRECEDDDPDTLLTFLAMKDRLNKDIAAIAVPEKGLAGGHTVTKVEKVLDSWGRGDIAIKSDNEKGY